MKLNSIVVTLYTLCADLLILYIISYINALAKMPRFNDNRKCLVESQMYFM